MIESSIERAVTKYAKKWGVPFVKLDPTHQKGIPDRMGIFKGGVVVFMELKTPTGKLGFHQIIWRKRILDAGHQYHVVTSVEQGKELIDAYV